MRRLIAVLAVLVAGCSSGPALVVSPSRSAHAYAGPLFVATSSSRLPARAGAAARVLQCDGAVFDGDSGKAMFEEAQAVVHNDPQGALREIVGNWTLAAGYTPTHGYRVARRAGSRVLYAYDVGGRTKAAVIVANGLVDYRHHRGWGYETWAQCDPAEFPDSVTTGMKLGVWTDGRGVRVSIRWVLSYLGTTWCDFDDTSSLTVGRRTYVRDPHHRVGEYAATSYSSGRPLPASAHDTGWHRDGREMWTDTGDAVYLVDRSDRTDVERWPAVQGVGCD